MAAKPKEGEATPEPVKLPETVAALLRAKRQAALAANADFQEHLSVVLTMLGFVPEAQVRINFDEGVVLPPETKAPIVVEAPAA